MILATLWFGGLAMIAASLWLAQLARRKHSRRLRFLLWIPAIFSLTVALVFFSGALYRTWFLYRPQPAPTRKELFQGVTYIRQVQKTPWPMVAHLLIVNLHTPGMRFFATPRDRSRGMEFRAMRTSEFLTSNHLQIAINAGFFNPFHSKSPWDYYPHEGDPVDILGLAESQGKRGSISARGFRTLDIDEENHVRMADHLTTGTNAISGHPLSLREANHAVAGATREPRTAVALNATSDTLIIAVIDGRQPNYSEGATLDELAGLLKQYGGASAINLDGGGSSTMVMAKRGGKARILNTPIHTHIPGRERPVGTHLGIYAAALEK